MRRAGTTLVEVLVALSAAVPLLWAAGALVSGALFCRLTSADPVRGSRTASSVVAWMESAVSNSGLGLPSRWERGLFRVAGHGPRWSGWGRPVTVGRKRLGGFVPLPDGTAGNAVRLVTALRRSGVAGTENCWARAGQLFDWRHAGRLVFEGAGVSHPSRWALVPGMNVPVFLQGETTFLSARALTARDAVFPAAADWYRLVAVELWFEDGAVRVNYQDGSGNQVLFSGVQDCWFRAGSGEVELFIKAGGAVRGRSWRIER